MNMEKPRQPKLSGLFGVLDIGGKLVYSRIPGYSPSACQNIIELCAAFLISSHLSHISVSCPSTVTLWPISLTSFPQRPHLNLCVQPQSVIITAIVKITAKTAAALPIILFFILNHSHRYSAIRKVRCFLWNPAFSDTPHSIRIHGLLQ